MKLLGWRSARTWSIQKHADCDQHLQQRHVALCNMRLIQVILASVTAASSPPPRIYEYESTRGPKYKRLGILSYRSGEKEDCLQIVMFMYQVGEGNCRRVSFALHLVCETRKVGVCVWVLADIGNNNPTTAPNINLERVIRCIIVIS